MLIEASDLSKRYGAKHVLTGTSFAVDAGEVVALAGPNGSGKTTTIRLLTGFLRADGGRVRVLDHDPIHRRHLGAVGWMSERPAFPRRLTAGRVIDFQAATFPTWDSELAEQLRERLAVDRRMRVEAMSRGQTARLALLLALAHRPRLLLLDDPTLGLDPKARRLLLGELLAAAAEEGTGVLISTHLLAEAEWSLDRLLVLAGGRITLDETVDSLKARCRRLRLPPGVEPPAELAPREHSEGTFATAFDEALWRPFQARAPEARCDAVGLEDLYIVFTEEDS